MKHRTQSESTPQATQVLSSVQKLALKPAQVQEKVVSLLAPPAVSVIGQPLAVNITDAARLVGVPAFTVREAIGNGSLTAKKIGRHYIIRVADLKRWIDSLDAVPTIPCFVKRAEARRATDKVRAENYCTSSAESNPQVRP
jgi:excisionase family DNA binding protein